MDRRGRLSFSRGCISRYAVHRVYVGKVLNARISAGPRICWNTIAEHLPGRSNKSCRKRWIHSLDPSLRKGPWRSTFLVIVLMAVQADGQHLKTHSSLRLYEGMVVAGIKSQSCYQVEPTINVPSDGGRNSTHQSVSPYFRSHYRLVFN